VGGRLDKFVHNIWTDWSEFQALSIRCLLPLAIDQRLITKLQCKIFSCAKQHDFHYQYFCNLLILIKLQFEYRPKIAKKRNLQLNLLDTNETVMYVFLKFFSNQNMFSLLYFTKIMSRTGSKF